MHSFKPPRAGRWAPFAVATVMSAIFAGPAFGQAAISVTYNTSDVLIAELNAKTVTVERGGTTLAPGTPAGLLGELGVNSAHIPGDTGCWDVSGFVPQILPGDTVTVEGQAPIAIPDMTAEMPTLEGDTVVVHGQASGLDQGLVSVQLHPANAGRFAGAVGSSGGQFLACLNPQGFSAVTTWNGTSFTTRFSGLGNQLQLAATSSSVVEFDPNALAAVDPPVASVVDYEAGAEPGGGGA